MAAYLSLLCRRSGSTLLPVCILAYLFSSFCLPITSTAATSALAATQGDRRHLPAPIPNAVESTIAIRSRRQTFGNAPQSKADSYSDELVSPQYPYYDRYSAGAGSIDEQQLRSVSRYHHSSPGSSSHYHQYPNQHSNPNNLNGNKNNNVHKYSSPPSHHHHPQHQLYSGGQQQQLSTRPIYRCYSCMSALYEELFKQEESLLARYFYAPRNFTNRCDEPMLGRSNSDPATTTDAGGRIGLVPCRGICLTLTQDLVVMGRRTGRRLTMRGCASSLSRYGFYNRTIAMFDRYDMCREVFANELFHFDTNSQPVTVCSCLGDRCNVANQLIVAAVRIVTLLVLSVSANSLIIFA